MKFKRILIVTAMICLLATVKGIYAGDSLVVHENGNVGVGISTPKAMLEIFSSVANRAKFITDDGTYFFVAQNVDQTDAFTFYVQHGANTTRGLFNVKSNGPSMEYSHFYIRGDGNIGVGTKNPSYKLDVNGIVRAHNVSASDARWKTNINTMENALEKISKLRGVTYEWIDSSRGAGNQIGVIAQEVEAVFPEVVSTDNEGYKSVAYSQLVAPLIEAVKTLKAENDQLKQALAKINTKLEKLQ
ncbi:MAG: tail fiber domain-containing protein [Desulfobacteraceae bacterium]|nr:tail fiber domain-containing protein [Desulfobacteraceae bacterium]